MLRLLSLGVLLFLTTTARADKLVLFAGGGAEPGNGPATKVKLNEPFGIEFDKVGNAYVVEISNRFLKIDPSGMLTVIASGKGGAGADVPAAKATFNGPHNLAIPAGGDEVFIADTWNGSVRKFDPKSNMIASVAGLPYLEGKRVYQYDGDSGPATKAKFSGIYCVAFNPAGDKLYITDLENRRIRVLNVKTGQVDLVAGNGKGGVPKDGSIAKESPLVDPRACAVDKKGNVYILERGGHALRVVDADGKIRTVVGTGKAGLSGDGGPGKAALLNGPKHLVVDPQGDVIIADSANHVIRKFSPTTGLITRVAGSGTKGASGDGGDALTVSMNEPHGVYVHPDGSLFIVDSKNGRIFRMTR